MEESSSLDLEKNRETNNSNFKKNFSQAQESKPSKLANLRQTVIEPTKFNINWINEKESEDNLYSFNLNLPDQCTVNDCLAFSLKEINKELIKKDLPYSLSSETNLFYLFLAKKNGRPKLDYPAFDYEFLISSTQSFNFTILGKDDSIFTERNKNDANPKNLKYDINLNKKPAHASFELRACSDDEEDYEQNQNFSFFKFFCPCAIKKKKYVKL